EPERRPIEGGHEDGGAGGHPYERLVHVVELDRPGQRRLAGQPAGEFVATELPGDPRDHAGHTTAYRGNDPTVLLQPLQIGVADEAVRMRPGKDHSADVGIAVSALDEAEQLGAILTVEQTQFIADKSREDHP